MKTAIRKAQEQLEYLNTNFKGNIVRENGVLKLDAGPGLGNGGIRCICFNLCMKAFEFDLLPDEDLQIPLNSPGSDVLYFMYCLEGESSVYLKDKSTLIPLEQLRTAAFLVPEEGPVTLHIKKDSRFVFNIIGIDKQRYLDEFNRDFYGLGGKIDELLNLFDRDEKSYHLGKYNLKIGEQIKSLNSQIPDNDISSFLQFEGLSNMILANQIEQFYNDIRNGDQNTNLNSGELQAVREISDFVKNYPEIQHSIKSVCSKSGLSPNKLQEGFKFMHDRTVSDYIRNVRIEKAEHLIKTTDMNISEVVYSIGLTSRSYFCKIFKNKYHCSPKQYKGRAIQANMSKI